MNIFVLDKDPILAAKFSCDKICIKMVVESAQMLSTAHHVLNKIKKESFIDKSGNLISPPSKRWRTYRIECLLKDLVFERRKE